MSNDPSVTRLPAAVQVIIKDFFNVARFFLVADVNIGRCSGRGEAVGSERRTIKVSEHHGCNLLNEEV